METPIFDFVQRYLDGDNSRLHMPGHKGMEFLGCERRDLTEISGADYLYTAAGIIGKSEENAAALFGTAATLYATEGSSQCIRAMLYLALLRTRERGNAGRPVVVAARNVHKVFVLAAAMLDFDIVWLWPESAGEPDEQGNSLCSCVISPAGLRKNLAALPKPPAAVYLTSPDYLGGVADIAGISAVAHEFSAPLLVDNAHGAYRRFLSPDRHPIALGADLCCDSAHKTLPVLTGGAYLHIAKGTPDIFGQQGRRAMELFGSTSPSYLILQSLDLCNRYLADGYPERLAQCVARLDAFKARLMRQGIPVVPSDELRLTLAAGKIGYSGTQLAEILEGKKVFCEFADPDYLVLMLTPETPPRDYDRLWAILSNLKIRPPRKCPELFLSPPLQSCTVRQAAFARRESVPVGQAVGRVLASTGVSCPPAVPVVVSGERIAADAVKVFNYYGITEVEVICE